MLFNLFNNRRTVSPPSSTSKPTRDSPPPPEPAPAVHIYHIYRDGADSPGPSPPRASPDHVYSSSAPPHLTTHWTPRDGGGHSKGALARKPSATGPAVARKTTFADSAGPHPDPRRSAPSPIISPEWDFDGDTRAANPSSPSPTSSIGVMSPQDLTYCVHELQGASSVLRFLIQSGLRTRTEAYNFLQDQADRQRVRLRAMELSAFMPGSLRMNIRQMVRIGGIEDEEQLKEVVRQGEMAKLILARQADGTEAKDDMNDSEGSPEVSPKESVEGSPPRKGKGRAEGEAKADTGKPADE